MGFSDNLENQLKNLEAREERDASSFRREQQREAEERRNRLATAPHAEKLRNGTFTQNLLAFATRIGFGHRVKVHITWIEKNLRLDARELRLELRPTPDGVKAHFFKDGQETKTEKVSLESDPEKLAQKWLSALDA